MLRLCQGAWGSFAQALIKGPETNRLEVHPQTAAQAGQTSFTTTWVINEELGFHAPPRCTCVKTLGHPCAQALNKGVEPDLSDRLMSFTGHRTLFSADTDSRHWRLVRKGVAPAFSPANIRRALG